MPYFTEYCSAHRQINVLAFIFLFKTIDIGASLAVQWLRLHTSSAGGLGSIPGQGTKILCAAWRGRNKTKQTNTIDISWHTQTQLPTSHD